MSMSVIADIAGRIPRAVVPAIRTTNIILAAVVAALGVGVYFALHTTPASTKATPTTSAVARGAVLSSVSASGNVQAASDLSVGFETSGQVVSVNVKPGDRVSKGQVVGRLDATSAQASVDQAVASLATAKATLAQAESGETAQQRQADAVSVKQARASIGQAQTSVRTARAQLRLDDATTKQSIASAANSVALSQNRTQLKTDRGSLAGAVAKSKADTLKLTVNGTTYATADEAVSAWNNIVNQDKTTQQAQTQANYDLQSQQTTDQQQLSADQASQKGASTADQSYWQNKVSADQDAVNYDARRLQEQAKLLNATQYQLSQDQASLQTMQTLQTTLSQDASSVTTDEAKVVSDGNQIASAEASVKSQVQTARSTRTSTLAKDRQSIVTAGQQLASAKLSLQSTLANNATKLTTTPATLAQSKAGVLQAEVSLATARRTLAQTVLRAPAAGTVAKVNGTVGQSVTGGGTSAISSSSSSSATGSTSSSTGSSSGFVELINLTGLEVTASFSEGDAAKIQLGQPGTVTVSALPNTELAAHVVAIDVSGTTSSGVVQYTVTMALDRTTSGLKPGMSANATVTTGERDNVLNVPNAAVTGSGANATVKVLQNGAQRTVNVVAGLKGDSTTEIQSGLVAGQQVVTSSGVVSTAGANSSTPGGLTGRGGGFGGGGFPGGGGGLPGG
jgi:multidrug efflux pump subunit AcrA (membrane-fusion protein)